MRRLLLLTILLTLALTALAPAAPTVRAARGNVLYVDTAGGCARNVPCFTHPQDAVNAAAAGDTIRVYPGTYGSRIADASASACNDKYAPPLIVYKNGLTIEAIDPDPAHTVIEATHACWSNPAPVRASTRGTVNPRYGSAPNAVSIIANGVVFRGFTVFRAYIPGLVPVGHSTILIGGLYEGYGMNGETVGFGGNTIAGCVVGSATAPNRNGVAIWHSVDNVVDGNTIYDGASAAVSIFDGNSDAEISLPSPSTGNRVTDNHIIHVAKSETFKTGGKAVFVGTWKTSGSLWTDNSGTKVYSNDCGLLGLYTAFSYGSKKFRANTNVGWTGADFASDYSFEGGKPVKALGPNGMSELQAGPLW